MFSTYNRLELHTSITNMSTAPANEPPKLLSRHIYLNCTSIDCRFKKIH